MFGGLRRLEMVRRNGFWRRLTIGVGAGWRFEPALPEWMWTGRTEPSFMVAQAGWMW